MAQNNSPINYSDANYDIPPIPRLNSAQRVAALRAYNAKNYVPVREVSYKEMQEYYPEFGESRFDSGIPEYQMDDLNEWRAQQQSGLEQIANGVLKGVVTAGTTLVNTLIGLPLGIGEAITEGKISKIWNNEITNQMADIEEAMEEYLPNYYTNAQLDSPWYSTENLFSTNFLGDKLIKNFGFSFGAGIGMKAVSMVPKLLPKLAKLATKSAGVARVINSAETALIGAVGEGSVEALHTVREFANSNIGIIEQEFQASNTLLEQQFLQQSEALQAQYGNTEMFPALKSQLNQDYQRAKKELEDKRKAKLTALQDQIDSTGNLVLAGNIPILWGSNIITLGKVLAKGYDAAERSLGKFVKQTTTDTGELLYKSTLTPTRQALRYISTPISEGLEEMNQSVVSTAAKNRAQDFYEMALDPNSTNATSGYIGYIGEALKQVYGDINNYEEFLIGAISSGISDAVVGQNKALREERQQVNQAVAMANQALGSFNNRTLLRNMNIQQVLENQKLQALIDNDKKTFKDSEFGQVASAVIAFSQIGKIDDLKALLDANLLNLSDAELEALASNLSQKDDDGAEHNAFALMPNEERRNYLTKQHKVYSDAIDAYNKARKELVNQTGNLFNPEQQAELIFYKLRANNAKERIDSINKEIETDLDDIVDSPNIQNIAKALHVDTINSHSIYQAIKDYKGSYAQLAGIFKGTALEQKFKDLAELQKDVTKFNATVLKFISNPQTLERKNFKIQQRVSNAINNRKVKKLVPEFEGIQTFQEFADAFNAVNPRLQKPLLNTLIKKGHKEAKSFVEKSNFSKHVADALEESESDEYIKVRAGELLIEAIDTQSLDEVKNLSNSLYSRANNEEFSDDEYEQLQSLLGELIGKATQETAEPIVDESPFDISDKDNTNTEEQSDEDFFAEAIQNLDRQSEQAKNSQEGGDSTSLENNPEENNTGENNTGENNPNPEKDNSNPPDSTGGASNPVDSNPNPSRNNVDQLDSKDGTPTSEYNEEKVPNYSVENDNLHGTPDTINDAKIGQKPVADTPQKPLDKITMGLQEVNTKQGSKNFGKPVIEQVDSNGNPTKVAKDLTPIYNRLKELGAFANVDNGVVKTGSIITFALDKSMQGKHTVNGETVTYDKPAVLLYVGDKCVGSLTNKEAERLGILEKLNKEFEGITSDKPLISKKYYTVCTDVWAGIIPGYSKESTILSSSDMRAIQDRMANDYTAANDVVPIIAVYNENAISFERGSKGETWQIGNQISSVFFGRFYKGTVALLVPTGAYNSQSDTQGKKAFIPVGLTRVRMGELNPDSDIHKQVRAKLDEIFESDCTTGKLDKIIGELKKLITYNYHIEGSIQSVHIDPAFPKRDDYGNIVYDAQGNMEVTPTTNHSWFRTNKVDPKDGRFAYLRIRIVGADGKSRTFAVQTHEGNVKSSTALPNFARQIQLEQLFNILVKETNAFANIEKNRLIDGNYVKYLFDQGLIRANLDPDAVKNFGIKVIGNSFSMEPTIHEFKDNSNPEGSNNPESSSPKVNNDPEVQSGSFGPSDFTDDDFGELLKAESTRTTEEKIDIKKEVNRIAKMLPQLNINQIFHIVDTLIKVNDQGINAMGVYKRNSITLSRLAETGTAYHEAFHLVFHQVLSREEREILLKEYEKKYPKLDKVGLEEQMAEDFREYCLTKENMSFSMKVKNFFKNLYSVIFGYKDNKLTFDTVASNIWKGKYANRELSESDTTAIANLKNVINNTKTELIGQDRKDYQLSIGSKVNQENRLDNLCVYTGHWAIGQLKKIGLTSVHMVTFKAKSPVMDKLIGHHAALLNIGGKLYLYDMPQTEYIHRTEKEITNNQYEGIIVDNYKPRLIEFSVENLVRYYGVPREDAALADAKWSVEDQYENDWDDNVEYPDDTNKVYNRISTTEIRDLQGWDIETYNKFTFLRQVLNRICKTSIDRRYGLSHNIIEGKWEYKESPNKGYYLHRLVEETYGQSYYNMKQVVDTFNQALKSLGLEGALILETNKYNSSWIRVLPNMNHKYFSQQDNNSTQDDIIEEETNEYYEIKPLVEEVEVIYTLTEEELYELQSDPFKRIKICGY